jgi:4-hydroxybenzoate polyprenyltransferase
MEGFLSQAMIPLLMVIILAYYAVRLLVLHDIDAIRGKDKSRKLKNEEMYAKEAGKLMLFLAVGSLVMAVLLYWNTVAAVVEVLIWIVIFGILWKKMDEKYGA